MPKDYCHVRIDQGLNERRTINRVGKPQIDSFSNHISQINMKINKFYSLDALLISTFFSQTKNKTGVSLENKIRESDGGINVETSQVKFNIKTFVSLIIGIVSAVFSGGMWLSGFFHEQTAQKKEIEELKNTLNRSTQKVDSLVQLKTGTLDEVKDKLIEIDAKLNRSKK